MSENETDAAFWMSVATLIGCFLLLTFMLVIYVRLNKKMTVRFPVNY